MLDLCQAEARFAKAGAGTIPNMEHCFGRVSAILLSLSLWQYLALTYYNDSA